MTTAFKAELLVIDFEDVGEDEIRALLANNKYLSVHIQAITSADLGEWRDDHPLNRRDTMEAEYRRLFP